MQKQLFVLCILSIALLAAVETRKAPSAERSLQSVQPSGTITVTVKRVWWEYIILSVQIIVGFFLCYFGVRFWAWNAWIMAVLGAITLVAVCKLVVGEYGYTNGTYGWVWIVAYVVAITCAVLLFYFMKKTTGAIIGVYLGAAVAAAICVTIGADQWWLRVIIAGILIAGGVVVGCVWPVSIEILGTAIVGGQCFCQGLGYVSVGMFSINGGNWLPWAFLAFTILVILGGIFVQCSYRKKHGHSEHLVGGDVQMEATVTIR